MLDKLTLERIRGAAETIAPYIRRTPCLERTTANATLCLKPKTCSPLEFFRFAAPSTNCWHSPLTASAWSHTPRATTRKRWPGLRKSSGDKRPS